jgi:hypothetical protein
MTAIIQRGIGVRRGTVAVVVSLAFAAGLALPASALASLSHTVAPFNLSHRVAPSNDSGPHEIHAC